MNYKKITFITMLIVIVVLLVAMILGKLDQGSGMILIGGILSGLFGFKTWERKVKKNEDK